MRPHYTRRVQRLAREITGLSARELLALNQMIKGLDPPSDQPDIGVREPREPTPPGLTGGIALEEP